MGSEVLQLTAHVIHYSFSRGRINFRACKNLKNQFVYNKTLVIHLAICIIISCEMFTVVPLWDVLL